MLDTSMMAITFNTYLIVTWLKYVVMLNIVVVEVVTWHQAQLK